ncbi:MAG: pyruvate ferredoxin oxidoreductase [Chloroflexi bacterium]|nr:pyruvate ferredoxin oxidoreductase [Chloroflexota bacterium]
MATKTANRIAVTGNAGVAQAMRQIRPDVVAAYPITPQSDVVEEFSTFVAEGTVPTEFLPVESEHSALSACVGASAAGARVMTATSSQGLAYMWEVLYIAAGNRCPIVMINVNRALSAPINIHCDHSDSMGTLHSGWIQLYCKNAQEGYDSTIMAVRIAEHPDIQLPVMVCYDGFIVSHGITSLEMVDDEEVASFIGTRKPPYSLLDAEHPISMGNLAFTDYYMEVKRQQAEAMRHAPRVIQEVQEEFGKLTGRHYGMFETYRLDDADFVLVALNSTASTSEIVVDELRGKGVKAGILRPRVMRPFPWQEIAQALSRASAVAVLDRAQSPGGNGGPLAIEVRSALYELERRPRMINGIYGLGGRDILMSDIRSVYDRLQKLAEGRGPSEFEFYLGVRGD